MKINLMEQYGNSEPIEIDFNKKINLVVGVRDLLQLVEFSVISNAWEKRRSLDFHLYEKNFCCVHDSHYERKYSNFTERANVLIKNIENGFHYSVINKALEELFSAVNSGESTCVIATTNSLEFIHKAIMVNKVYDILALFRLEKKEDGAIKVVEYNKEDLETSLEFNWEIR
jgi:hypothetical protein